VAIDETILIGEVIGESIARRDTPVTQVCAAAGLPRKRYCYTSSYADTLWHPLRGMMGSIVLHRASARPVSPSPWT
jgi:hypothetical protein